MIGRCVRVLPVLLLTPLLGAHAGGWAVVTVEELPDYTVAQQELQLTFTVRQHGTHPMNDLKPTVAARAGERTAHGTVTRGKGAGQYQVALTLPEPGDWSINIHTRFGESQVTLLPLRATGGGAFTPPSYTAAQRGQRLFVAKGCIACHQHAGVKGYMRTNIGPDLSEPRLTPEFMARFIADPTIRPPTTPNNRMPNLGIDQKEIAALVAFLSGPAGKSGTKSGNE